MAVIGVIKYKVLSLFPAACWRGAVALLSGPRAGPCLVWRSGQRSRHEIAVRSRPTRAETGRGRRGGIEWHRGQGRTSRSRAKVLAWEEFQRRDAGTACLSPCASPLCSPDCDGASISWLLRKFIRFVHGPYSKHKIIVLPILS